MDGKPPRGPFRGCAAAYFGLAFGGAWCYNIANPLEKGLSKRIGYAKQGGDAVRAVRKSVYPLLAIFAALALGLAACGPGSPAAPEEETTAATTEYVQPVLELKLATTAFVNDSGLLEALRESLLEEEKLVLYILVYQDSADAIRAAKDGKCDVLIAHSPAAERDFEAKGGGAGRRPFMHNYFVVAGPPADPAGAGAAKGAGAALERLYDAYRGGADCAFYSRDDGSWADSKEKNLWAGRGLDTDALPSRFYQKVRGGMLDTLLAADGAGGYAVADKLTFLQNAESLPNLAVLLDNSAELKNVYSVTLLSAEKYPKLQHEAAKRFQDWLLLPSTQARIGAFGLEQYGEPLFFPGE